MTAKTKDELKEELLEELTASLNETWDEEIGRQAKRMRRQWRAYYRVQGARDLLVLLLDECLLAPDFAEHVRDWIEQSPESSFRVLGVGLIPPERRP